MSRQQILLSVAGIILIVLMYQLPRVVVENEQLTEVDAGNAAHDLAVSPEDAQRMRSLQNQLKVSADSKKSIKFADSLAGLLLKYQMTDSAIGYAERVLLLGDDFEAKRKAGMIYYRAFQQTASREKAMELAGKARSIFEHLLAIEPENSSLKNKLAMTLVTSEAPMRGIMMLREILEKEPENREAILNLGVLAIQSGQYEKAIGRFDTLLGLDPADHEAMFYKGVALAESGKTEEAAKVLNKLMKEKDVDPALSATASSYIKELENILIN